MNETKTKSPKVNHQETYTPTAEDYLYNIIETYRGNHWTGDFSQLLAQLKVKSQ
jgi:hypothetical protein